MSCPKCGHQYVWQPLALEPYWSLDTDPHTRIKFCPFCGWNLAKDVAKDVVPLALTPADNEYLAQRKRAQEEAIAAFGVPPSVMDDVHLRREKPRHISDDMVLAGPPLRCPWCKGDTGILLDGLCPACDAKRVTPPLTWTREIPTEPGLYWGIRQDDGYMMVIHICRHAQGWLWVDYANDQSVHDWEWLYGPLPIEIPDPPKESP